MPSRFEPCGQGQMIALRYGTPPIVHATGGLRDTVIDEYDAPGRGTGYSFRHPTATGLAWASHLAVASHAAREPGPLGWDALVARGMAVDFDWVTGSAPRYLAEYRRAIEIRRSATPVVGSRRLPVPGRSGTVRSTSGTIPA
jgi:starch synthase